MTISLNEPWADRGRGVLEGASGWRFEKTLLVLAGFISSTRSSDKYMRQLTVPYSVSGQASKGAGAMRKTTRHFLRGDSQ